MADKTLRNSGGSQPISQHPLFPAIVALWFGALSGLCSLALKPALIERLVVATGIDSFIPMAAPPLGTTTRILLALALTGLGGLIGALIARRIARPKVETRERRRSAAPAKSALAKSATATRDAGNGRRRALALAEAEAPDIYHDHAPVPGRESGILNVSEFALDGFEEPAPVSPDLSATLDAEYEEIEPDTAIGFAPEVASAPIREGATGVFMTREIESPLMPEDAQVFSPVPGAFDAPEEDEEDADFHVGAEDPTELPFAIQRGGGEAAAPDAGGNRLFEAYSRQIADRAQQGTAFATPSLFPNAANTTENASTPGFELLPRLNLGEWGEDADEANHAETAAPTPLFAAPAPERSFDAPVDSAPEALEETAASNEDVEDEVPAEVAGFAPAEAMQAFETTQSDSEEAAPCEPVQAEAPRDPSAAERIAGSELGELSQVELLERLALAMAQRREEVRARHLAAEREAQQAEAERAEAEAAAAAAAAAPAFASPVAPAPEPETIEFVEEEVAEEAFDLDPQLAVEPLTFERLPFAAPVAETATAADEPASFAAPQAREPRPIPAALRPVVLDSAEDDDILPGYIPPRHIGLPSANLTDQPLAAFAEDSEAEESDDEEARVLEEGYSSLLNLSRAGSPGQHGFVRIEEPECDEIEPVVIFPGEDNRAGQAPFAAAGNDHAPAPAPAIEATERLFDAPARPDAAETERALRAALATLQRMSGAA